MTDLVLGNVTSLAQRANEQHRQVVDHFGNAVTAAIACGQTLIEVRQMIPANEWQGWVDNNLEFSREHASGYMRLAIYEDKIPINARTPQPDRRGHIHQPSVSKAVRSLAGLPSIMPTGRPRKYPDEMHDEIKSLSAKGWSTDEIAGSLNVSTTFVKSVLKPSLRKEQQQRAYRKSREAIRARKALEREQKRLEDARVVSSSSGAISEMYSLIRRAAGKYEKAKTECGTPESRQRMSQVISMIHRTEDELIRVMKAL